MRINSSVLSASLWPRLRCRSIQTSAVALNAAAVTHEPTEGERGLRILIFGKPGSGKGTLSARLVQKYDLKFIATGDVLRREIMMKTELGRAAESIVAAGGLVPDELMLNLINKELDNLPGKSWILDGFPRTLKQGIQLDEALTARNSNFNMIIHLAVPDSVILKRISARWVHLPSGRVYNTSFGSSCPKVPGKDDVTGEDLVQRPDDNPESFAKRLTTFHESTSPLLQYFEERYPEHLHSLQGATSNEVKLASSFSYHAKDPDVDLSLAAAPSDNIIGVEKIWPKLVAVIEAAGLHQSPQQRSEQEEEVRKARKEADDLNDPEESLGKKVKE